MIFGPSHSFIWTVQNCTERNSTMRRKEGGKDRKHLAEDRQTPRTGLDVLLPDSEF